MTGASLNHGSLPYYLLMQGCRDSFRDRGSLVCLKAATTHAFKAMFALESYP